jgi:2,3-bisphosphoglycerate-independent phosphoglycerate mutase
LLILLDGLGDRAYAEFGFRTPLQAANTPTLDRLARLGANGLYHAGSLGQALPSENAHFAMFGYDLAEFPGRGALEALGAGVDLSPSEVAVLAHFVSVRSQNGQAMLVEDLPRATEDEALALMEAVSRFESDVASIVFHRTKGLFGVLVVKGPGGQADEVSPFVTDSNPMRDGKFLSEIVPWTSHAGDPAAIRTAAALTDYLRRAHMALSPLPLNAARAAQGLAPINCLVTQRAGQIRHRAAPFPERFGLRGLSIASGVVFKGLAKLLGMDFLAMKETDDPAGDMDKRLRAAREAMADHEYIHLHTKAPDEAAHRKDPQLKKAIIEALDEGIGRAIGPLLDDPEVLIIVTADHSTPSSGNLVHSGEPVPLTFCGPGVRRDTITAFDEVSAAGGALGCVRGRELMALVLNYLDRAKLQGIMDSPHDREYWPGDYRPFRLG